MATDEQILTDALEAFEKAQDAEGDNRQEALEDLEFARLGVQWDPKILQIRRTDGRPALTINKMPAFIRQVVNDARQNKPQIKVRPVDSGADIETAEVVSGLIRSIERQSNADVAYDTAGEFAVTCGFGYFRIDVDYSHNDTFDQDILIDRIADPFSVYGDPESEAADSSDWNSAFVVSQIPVKEFEARWKDAEQTDWEAEYQKLPTGWYSEEEIQIAEWWTREEVERSIYRLSDGAILDEARLESLAEWLPVLGVTVEGERAVRGHKVTHRLMTGAEVLEETEWPGKYIPIVPVYGEEVNVQGKRYFRSLIRDAKDAQRMVNYWRTMTTELVALAPKAPWVGHESQFTGKSARDWETANTENHAKLAYSGDKALPPPQRVAFAGVPAGALQEALNASDDMKGIIGLYDASLGARSNETSGRAIMARQREGDVSTFHFLDNLSRAIRHGGRIVLDLIPHVYTGPRIIRTLGEDDSVDEVQIAPGQQQAQAPQVDPRIAAMPRIFDLTAGKYDLAVEAGPSFTTRRQEAAEAISEIIQVLPASATVLAPRLLKMLDFPGADEIAKELQALLKGGEDPRLAQMGQQLQQAMQQNQKLEDQLRKVMGDHQVDMFKAQVDAFKTRADAETRAYDAETKRMGVVVDAYEADTAAENPAGPYDKYQ